MTDVLSVTDHEKRARLIRTTLKKISNLEIERDEINGRVKAEYDALEANGLNRKALKHAAKMLALEEKKRFEYEKTKAIVYAAMGWQFQADLFAEDGGDDAEQKGEQQLPGLGAEDLADVDTSDDPGEDDEGDFTRAEIDEQERIAAAG